MHRLRTLIDIFGLPFLGDTNDSEEEAIVNHLLTKAMGHEEQLSYLSESHIKEVCYQVIIRCLTSMCESHARLSLRTSVTYEDAVAVLFLYEESITSLFGPSLISSAPKRTITPSDTISIARQVSHNWHSLFDE
ncbi:hypothetical protein AAG570_003451 [Ranatra chinensis]|uniref:Uncharacterized protein n=1 Tax=Ranatra chinensis TaxID=642074 RepID=A0ABD0Y3Q1_9HEMI